MNVIHTIPQFNENALTVLSKRYLLPGETPADLLRRASLGNDAYYEAMAKFDLLPNSPTLFNAGTDMGTLSACFKFDVADSLVDGPMNIFDTARKSAAVQQFGGGVGYVLSALRPRGSKVKTTHGVASGPVSFLTLYNAVANCITQGGKRNGAQMAILHCDHEDIREFIHCKDDVVELLGIADDLASQGKEKAAEMIRGATLSTFNISVAATDEFMERCIKQDNEDDFGINTSLLMEMAMSAWRTGDPGCYFIDTSERSNPTPWLFKLTGTNPCGEVPLGPDEPCNLMSINLGNFVVKDSRPGGFGHFGSGYSFDLPRLERVTRLAIRFLDDILDANKFPTPEITAAALLTRKLGLGGMGWADALALLRLHYDDPRAVFLAEELWDKVNDWADDESLKLGREKGPAPCFVEGKASGQYDGPMYRNATRTCWAPTGTISLLVGASSGCEPHFATRWTRYMDDSRSGQRVAIEEHIPVLDRTDFVPKTAMEIDWRAHIAMQAAFQKRTGLAVSKTINLPESATVQDIYDAYVMAWRTGCKGVTVYRDNCRKTQVLNAEPTEAVQSFPEELAAIRVDVDRTIELAQELLSMGSTPVRRRLPDERPAIVHKFRVGDQEGYIQVGLFDDGKPGELFVTVSKEGSTLRGLLETVGILTSLCLQYGVPLEPLCRKMQGINFEPYGMTGNPAVPTATSVVDYIFHWMLHRFLPETVEASHDPVVEAARDKAVFRTVVEHSGNMCPQCGSGTIMQEGCQRCSSCDWSRC